MRVIVPRSLSLVTSNVPETLHGEWSPSTNYVAGNRVYVTSVTPHKIYEAQDSTLAENPTSNPIKWREVGATNRWAMFDTYLSTPTENTDTIQVTVASSKADRVALFGLTGESVRIVVKNGATVIADDTLSLRLDSQSRSWSEYFFNDIEYRTNLVHSIPGYYVNLELEITITAATGTTARCGHCVVGRSRFIGASQWGVKTGITDYSRKETNEFGDVFLNQRGYSKPLEVDLFIDTPLGGIEVDRVERILAPLRAIPCVWDANNHDGDIPNSSGDKARETLLVFGFYKDFSTVVKYANATHCSLEIEGLTLQ